MFEKKIMVGKKGFTFASALVNLGIDVFSYLTTMIVTPVLIYLMHPLIEKTKHKVPINSDFRSFGKNSLGILGSATVTRV